MNKDVRVRLGDRILEKNSKPYIIAEIGVNHNGSIDNAKLLIDSAAESGADAVKFQTYKASTLTVKDSPAYWDTNKENTLSQYELFKKYDSFDYHDYVALYKHCKKQGIEFLSTPFDDDSVDFLDALMPFYKISSSDITNLPFLRKIAAKRKPVILSTGASSLNEINFACKTLDKSGCNDIILLHCILNYPTEVHNAHLNMITGLIKEFPNLIIGYSDHTLPDNEMTTLVSAFLLGAVVIEKHFTFDKTLPGNDHYHAMDGDDLKKFVSQVNKIHSLRGELMTKMPIKTEEISIINARRSIVLSRDLMKDHIIGKEDITYKRPGSGISPIYWDSVIGKSIAYSLKADHVLNWEDLKSQE